MIFTDDTDENRMRSFVVTGMVRSGTTLLSRMLDAHPLLCCPPDPLMGFFRSFDKAVRINNHGLSSSDLPLTDFFYNGVERLTDYETASLKLPLVDSLPELRSQISSFAKPNCPDFSAVVNSVHGSNYEEIFLSSLETLAAVYGSEKTACVGFKQTWVEALIPALIGSVMSAACIHLIRDPRAVIASWIKSTSLSHDYAFLMVIRHWRKSVALASKWSSTYRSYSVLKYEDLVSEPEASMRKLCALLEVPFSHAMLQGDKYRDTGGNAWKSNSSYSAGDSSNTADVSSAYVKQWEKRLQPESVALIEELCRPEMVWLGMEFESSEPSLFNLDFKFAPSRDSQFEPTPHSGGVQYELNEKNTALEHGRWVLANELNSFSGSDQSSISGAFTLLENANTEY